MFSVLRQVRTRRLRRRAVDALGQSLRSGDAAVRGSALQMCLQALRADPLLGDEVLPMLVDAAAADPDPFTAVSAVQGIAAIRGAEAARDAWNALLLRDDPAVVAHAAMSITDAALAPRLAELLIAGGDTRIVRSVIRTLGRLRDPATWHLLVDRLQDPAWRADAALSLAEFGDPAALKPLAALPEDRSPCGMDERGVPLLVCDVVAEAIRLLRSRAARAAGASVGAGASPAASPAAG